MVAGAGSGKTTSLVKALATLASSKGKHLIRDGKQIACITFTEVAAEEIQGDVGHDALFHVSTIHSFLWSIIKPFQANLREWVYARLDQKIAEAEETIAKPRARAATKERAAADIERYHRQKSEIKDVKSFRYGTGSDYTNGILGHSDIIAIGPQFIREYPLMRQVLLRRFPFVFVDESQDTDPAFVEALRVVAQEEPNEFCLGFFGDPVQKIYMQGAGAITAEDGWEVLQKPENFRCPSKVMAVINKIRAEDDGLVQTGGRTEVQGNVLVPVEGTARIIVLPADDQRQQRLELARTWLSEQDNDQVWISEHDEQRTDLRLLVLVHRMAANRLGFPNLYSALNDKAPENLKSGLVDGTAWVLRPLLSFVLPVIEAHQCGANFEVMRLLRKHSPRAQPECFNGQNAAEALKDITDELNAVVELFAPGADNKIGDIISLISDLSFFALDERFLELIDVYQEGKPIGEDAPENAGHRFMRCGAEELLGYQRYVEDLSPFSTQQGIKGAEFEKVIVVIDDQEAKTNTFSYGKYFGVTKLSQTDQKNLDEGKDSVIDRTRRLFYVCCSRTLQDLVVIVFSEDPDQMHKALLAKSFFDPNDIHLLN